MFGKVIESGRSFGGQYLYVVAELATLRKPKINFNDIVIFPDILLKIMPFRYGMAFLTDIVCKLF